MTIDELLAQLEREAGYDRILAEAGTPDALLEAEARRARSMRLHPANGDAG